MNSVDFIIKRNSDSKDNIFIIDEITGKSQTYGKFLKASCKISFFLKSQRIRKGERIIIILDNSLFTAELYFACLYCGIVVIPVNPILTEQEIAYIMKNSDAKMIIVSVKIKTRLSTLLESCNISVFLANEEKAELFNSKSKKINLETKEKMELFEGVTSDDLLIIVYTSGTTGVPKGVMHKISNLIDNGRVFVQKLQLNEKNRFINILPMTYLGGYYNLLLIPFIAGGSVVISKAFNSNTAIKFWESIRKFQVNTLWLVPTIIAILLEIDRGKEGEDYCSKGIISALVGTAPLPTALKRKFEDKYNIKLYENYGLTETFFISTNYESKNKDNSVGYVLDDVDVAIFDSQNEKLQSGEEGEISVKTPYRMLGYYNHEIHKQEISLIDGYFLTGDIGFIDNNRMLYITGRKKDLIIRGGINISPESIENVLYRNPSILECAVVGFEHKILGEEIAVVLRLKEGVEQVLIEDELRKLCKENLAMNKQPVKYFVLEELPHTSSGKIQKAKIRAWVKDELAKNDISLKTIKKKTSPDIIKRYFQPSKIVAESIQAMSIKYNNTVYEMQRKGIDVIVLSLGEAFFDIPLYSFSDLPFPNIYHYSHSRGVPELRENLAKYFLSQYGVEYNPQTEIIITAGSKIAIHMALMSLLNPGDEVLVYEPAWVSYPEQIKLCYGIAVQIPYYENVFDFEKYITNRTKVIIINNPNNPTGKVYTLDELSYLYSLAEKYNLFVLSDEAYSDFLLNEDQFVSLMNLDSEKRHTIVCNSISKNYGISGWRLGYIITNEALINQIIKVNQHLITCPATILEYYIAKHFFEIIKITKPQILKVVEKRKKVTEYMDSIGLSYLPGTATFYIFASIGDSALNSEEFCTRLLEESHVCTVPGVGYGKSCDRFIRISIGTESLERTFAGISKIKELIKKTGK